MNPELAAPIAEALDEVIVSADLRSALVGPREVSGEGRRRLQARLAAALYDAWHVGGDEREGPRPAMRRDPAFEQKLRAAVPHEYTTVPARLETAHPPVVWLDLVRVRIPADRLVAGTETLVRVPAALPARSPGHLMVDGSRGSGMGGTAIVRVYLHLDSPEPAPAVWGAVLERLEELGATYRAKVTSTRWSFPRRDAIVVYLGQESWPCVPEIHKVAAGGLGEQVSPYVARLDAGVGWAFEPDDPRPGMRGLSFGLHRSHAVAEGIVAAASQGSEDWHQAIAGALLAARILPGEPYRNVGSPEVPQLRDDR